MQSSETESVRAPILAILLFETFALIARSFLQIELLNEGASLAAAKNLSYFVVPPILLVTMFPILRQYRGFLAARFGLSSLSLRVVVIAILVGLLLRVAYWGKLIAFAAFGIFRNADPLAMLGPSVSFDCPPFEAMLLHLVVMALLVPVIEEIINRGFLLYSLLHRSRFFAIVISSILFAIYHSPESIPTTFVIGLFLAVMALNTASLWPPLIAHATYNALNILDWLCVNTIWNPQESTAELNGVGLMAFVGTVCALLAVSRLIGQKCAGTGQPSRRVR